MGALHPHFREASLDDLYYDYASAQILIGEDCSGRQVTILDIELGDCLHEPSQPGGVEGSIEEGLDHGVKVAWAIDAASCDFDCTDPYVKAAFFSRMRAGGLVWSVFKKFGIGQVYFQRFVSRPHRELGRREPRVRGHEKDEKDEHDRVVGSEYDH
jgi:hypothetical protein